MLLSATPSFILLSIADTDLIAVDDLGIIEIRDGKQEKVFFHSEDVIIYKRSGKARRVEKGKSRFS